MGLTLAANIGTVRTGRRSTARSGFKAFGHTFRSFGYPAAEPLQSGDITTAVVTAPGGQVPIDDTYWSEEDYRGALTQAGFAVAAVNYPRPHDPAAWSTDEATVPPFIVIRPPNRIDRARAGSDPAMELD